MSSSNDIICDVILKLQYSRLTEQPSSISALTSYHNRTQKRGEREREERERERRRDREREERRRGREREERRRE